MSDYKTICGIILQHCGRVYQVLYDQADKKHVDQHKWYIVRATSGKLYAVTRTADGEVAYMHRLLAPSELRENARIAHRDGNTLNNTRANLCRSRNVKANRTGLRNITVYPHRVAVRMVIKKKRVTKNFSFKKHGSADAALEAAIVYRDRLFETND